MNIFKSKDSQNGRSYNRTKNTPEKQTRISPATVEHHLKGIQFPISKDELISYAQENDAPDEIVHLLEEMDDGEYKSPIDISKEIGRLRPRTKIARGPSPSKVEHFIKGIHFPAQRNDLVRHAKKNNAPSEIIELLEQMSDHEYRSPIDISKEMGRMKSQGTETKTSSKESISSAQFKRYLKGIEYPASKDDVIFSAQDNNAPNHVLSLLDDLDEDEYDSFEQLYSEIEELAEE